MRVWIVNHHADPPDGLATRSFDLARRLVVLGHDVTIFVSNFSHYRFRRMRQITRPALWRGEVIDGVQFIWIQTPDYHSNNWRRVVNMAAFAATATMAGALRKPHPDVVVGVSVHPLAALAGWALARLHRARFVFEVTDLWPQTLIDFGRIAPNGLMAQAMRALERFLFVRATRIVMLWRDAAAYVERTAGVGERVTWIPHVADPERYKVIPAYDGGLRRPFTIMFLGGFLESNCVDTILLTAAEVQRRNRDDICFELVGAGAEKATLMKQAQQLGLRNVTFPVPVPKSEVPVVMGRADAFVYGLRNLPLYQYGISLNKLADYLASGRPIVFFGQSSYNPVSQANAGVTIPSGEPADIADAIERLVALSPEQRVAMGYRGKQHLMAHHDIDMLTARLLAVLSAQPGGRPSTGT